MRLKNAELERELKQLTRNADADYASPTCVIQQPAPQEVDEFDKIGDEEFIPLGKVKKLAEKNTQKVTQKHRRTCANEVQKALQEARSRSIHRSLESSIFRFFRDRQP